MKPYARELGLHRCDQGRKPAGVTLSCDPDVGVGGFWIYCATSGLFEVRMMDLRLGSIVDTRLDYPEFYALDLLLEASAFDTWREGFVACASQHAAFVPPAGIIGYHQKAGTFACPLRRGARVLSLSLQFAPPALERLARRFRVERRAVERACFDPSAMPPRPSSFAEQALRQLFAAAPAPTCADMYYEGKVLEVISLLLQDRLVDGENDDKGRDEPDAMGIERALRFIAAHLGEQITLENLEHEATMGRTKLCRLFKERTGHAPLKYAAHARMMRALRLLRETEAPVEAIARAVGYESPGAFSERFKAECGFSPREVRTQRRAH